MLLMVLKETMMLLILDQYSKHVSNSVSDSVSVSNHVSNISSVGKAMGLSMEYLWEINIYQWEYR